MLLQEVSSIGVPVSIDARSIETVEPQPGGALLCFVGLRSGRTLWVRSAYEPLRDRWLAARAAPEPEPAAEGWRAGVRKAAAVVREGMAKETLPGLSEALATLAATLDGLADDGPSGRARDKE